MIHDPHTCNACRGGYNRADNGEYAVVDEFAITDMDFVRAAIANAMAENMTLQDLWACAEHAADVDDFDDAVNVLAQMPVGDSAG